MNWDQRFELAKAYYEHYGNLRIAASFKTKNGYDYDEEGFELGKWVNRQRQQYRLKEMTSEHYKKLESIGMVFINAHEYEWEVFYTLAQIYFEHYGHLTISKDFRTKNGYERDETGKSLGAWLCIQKIGYNHKTLSQERMEKIHNLYKGLEEKKKNNAKKEALEWERMYNLAKSYYEHYGHLTMPRFFKTNNGYTPDEVGEKLALWIRKQRSLYIKGLLTEEQIKKLEQIDMVFLDVNAAEWERMYNLAKSYYEHHGNLEVPRYFKTKNGFQEDKLGSNLGVWLNKQYCRNIDGYLTQDERQRLELIGMSFENQKEIKWNEMYALAKIYYEHYGNLEVPINFKTNNGYEYDENGQTLGIWVSSQRRNYSSKKDGKTHIKKLKEIGIIFENLHDVRWERMYNLAEAYYQHHKHLNIEDNFKTENGYEYSEKGENLGHWLSKQRTYYKHGNLYKDRELRLRKIGAVLDGEKHLIWDNMYKLAVAYYNYYHNLRIRIDFRTKNGIDYEPEGKRLGEWICEQRTKYKTGTLSEECLIKLQAIGMLFELGKNRAQNEALCRIHGIKYGKYKKQIDTIPHREFSAKVNYLYSQNIPFIVENQLNPIFFMSSMNMQVRYGISLEQLISEYQISSDKVKGL